MPEEEQETTGGDSELESGDEEQSVELPISTYFLLNFVAFAVPLFPVVALGFAYFHVTGALLGLDVFWQLLFLPGLVLAGYLLYLFGVAYFTKLEIDHWDKVSPPEQGEYLRTFTKEGVADPRLHYYHLRGFVIKYPMWIFLKSPFPWMVNWLLRRVAHNKIGRDVVMENVMVGLEFTDVGDGVYYGPGSSLSSHVVDSVFGKLSIFTVTVGKDGVIGPNSILGPGATLRPGENFMPNSVAIKHWKGKEGVRFHSGSPGRPLRDYPGILALEEQLGIPRFPEGKRRKRKGKQ
ncbi:MAG: hypothetical protein ACTSU5_20540 [Promethearchaeota archaeon]